jgi:hypothetical protein
MVDTKIKQTPRGFLTYVHKNVEIDSTLYYNDFDRVPQGLDE